MLMDDMWSAEGEIACQLAAFRCFVDFGPFSEERHRAGFLKNTLSFMMDKDPIKYSSTKTIERNVLCLWREFSQCGSI